MRYGNINDVEKKTVLMIEKYMVVLVGGVGCSILCSIMHMLVCCRPVVVY